MMFLSRTRHLSSLSSRVLAPATRRFLSSDGPSAEQIEQIQGMFKKDPSKAKAVFTQHSVMTKGLVCEGDVRDGKFTINADEPEMFGGTDTAPNPIEILLFALASCQEITYKAYANAMNVPLKSVTIDLKGDIDFRGFFAVDPQVRPGFNKITGSVQIDSPASMKQLENLKMVVDGHCPVKDMMANVPMEIDLVKV